MALEESVQLHPQTGAAVRQRVMLWRWWWEWWSPKSQCFGRPQRTRWCFRGWWTGCRSWAGSTGNHNQQRTCTWGWGWVDQAEARTKKEYIIYWNILKLSSLFLMHGLTMVSLHLPRVSDHKQLTPQSLWRKASGSPIVYVWILHRWTISKARTDLNAGNKIGIFDWFNYSQHQCRLCNAEISYGWLTFPVLCSPSP